MSSGRLAFTCMSCDSKDHTFPTPPTTSSLTFIAKARFHVCLPLLDHGFLCILRSGTDSGI
jgi:hypothetical protein